MRRYAVEYIPFIHREPIIVKRLSALSHSLETILSSRVEMSNSNGPPHRSHEILVNEILIFSGDRSQDFFSVFFDTITIRLKHVDDSRRADANRPCDAHAP